MDAATLWASLDEAWEPRRVGPRTDPLARFGQMIAFLGRPPSDGYCGWMRAAGESGPLDLALRLRADGEVTRLAALDVGAAFVELEPELDAL
jgi:hypothetical protein